MQRKTHRPIHYYIDNNHYFLTGSTYLKIPFFNNLEKLDFIHKNLLETSLKYSIVLEGWTILHNHYHLLFYMPHGHNLHNFIRKLHSVTAIFINKIDKTPKRQIWYQYWDRCIRSEKDYYARLNYIHHNCIKHGYAKNMEDYKFSSYQTYLNKHGIDWVNDCFSTYPITDFTPDFEDNY